MRTLAALFLAASPVFAAQGTLYDGALDPACGYAFSTAGGIDLSIKQPDGPICDPPGDPEVITVVAGPVALSPSRTGGVIVDAGLSVVSVSPEVACPSLEEASNDCELLASGMAPGCLASIRDGAQRLYDQITACVDAGCNDYASLVNLIDQAPLPSQDSAMACPLGGDISPDIVSLPRAGLQCNYGITDLWNLRLQLDSLAGERIYCNAFAKDLEFLRGAVKSRIQESGGLSDSERNCFREMAEATIDGLTQLARDAKKNYAQLHDDPLTSCDPKVLKASCEDCDHHLDRPSEISAWVVQTSGSSALSEIVRTFSQSAAATRDGAESQRLTRIAQRLAAVSAEEIVEVSYPTRAPIAELNLALRNGAGWPQVVVLSPYRSDIALTAADRAALEDARALFRYTLGR